MTRRLELSALLFLVAGLARAEGLPSPDDAMVTQVAAATWKAAPKPVPEGVQVAPIAVDPATKASIAYAKFPPGLKFPTHTHSFNEYTVLISGKATFTLDGVAHELAPGSYIVIPAKTKHSVVCGPGAECVLLTRRAGPTDYQFMP
jgi:quercetin dioxygenase-like cupin family protein